MAQGMIAEFGKSALGIWQDWSVKKRIAVVGTVVVSILVFVFLVYFFARPVYQPLYSGLTYHDAGQITTKLKELGVPYQLKNDGTTILVPADKVYETRIELASLDIPRGSTTGFELFDVSKLGTTDFERQVNYKRALEGELTRTILEIDGVQSARVHIVLPEKSLFIRDERKPTASVLLGLSPYAEMTPRQINGIVNLIANSVEGLSKEDVTVIDTRGNVLSDMLGDVSFLANSQGLMAQMEIERRYEQELQQAIQSMLEQIYGFGKVVARARVELDFDLIEAIEESFSPVVGNEGIILKEEVFSEIYTGTGSSVPIQAGDAGSIDAPTYEWYMTGDGDYEREERSIEYGVNRSERRHVVTPGSVKRLSVVVWIDGELSDIERTNVENAVASTVGYSQSRGDTIHVASARFSGIDSMTDFSVIPGTPPVAYNVLIPVVVAGVLALVTMLVVSVIRGRRVRREAIDLVTEGMMEMASTAEPEDGAFFRREMSPHEKEFEELIKQLKKWTEEKPMEMVQLIRMWTNEER